MGARQSGRRQKTWSIQMENIKFEPRSVTKSQGCELQGTLGSMGKLVAVAPTAPRGFSGRRWLISELELSRSLVKKTKAAATKGLGCSLSSAN